MLIVVWGGSTMEVPCQCLSSFLAKHPSVVLSILSSAPLNFTEQGDGGGGGRWGAVVGEEEEGQGEEAGGWRRRGSKDAVTRERRRRRRRGTRAASVKGHGVLQLDEQALRGTNKIVTAAPPVWQPPHLTLYFVKWTISYNWTAIFTSLKLPFRLSLT